MADAVAVDRFMEALTGVESSWTPAKERTGDWAPYTATNARSGAYGRFQFMPGVAVELAQRHLRLGITKDDVPVAFDGATEQGRARQNEAARRELLRLHRTYKDWRRVAGFWRSGFRGTARVPAELTDGDRRYVSEVMARLGFPPVPDSTARYVLGRYWYDCPETPPPGVTEEEVVAREAAAVDAGARQGRAVALDEAEAAVRGLPR